MWNNFNSGSVGWSREITLCFMLQLLMLRTIGILLPIYVMIKAFTAIQRHRNQLVSYGFDNRIKFTYTGWM